MSPVAVSVRFRPQEVVTTATVGELLLTVARRAGISIPTGCCLGSCHACEVELEGEPVCSCITAVPPAQGEIVVELYSDPAW
jgi:ferredoxin